MKISNYFKKYSFLIGIILFIIILQNLDIKEIIKNIKDINILYLLAVIALLVPTLIIKSFCWNYILRKQKIKYSLKDTFIMYCSGLYFGIITPGRIGEITRALYLKKDGHSMGKSLMSIVLDRISDFAFLFLFILLGGLFFVTTFQKEILIFVIGIIIIIVFFLFFLKIGLIKWFLNKLFQILTPKKYQKSWKINFQDFINDLKIFSFKNYLIIFLITAFSWSFYYFQAYLFAKGMNINIPFLYLTISVTIAGFITLIPISISGIGSRDAALILLFAPYAVPKEQIIIFSALILLIALFTAFIGLICWLIKPLKL